MRSDAGIPSSVRPTVALAVLLALARPGTAQPTSGSGAALPARIAVVVPGGGPESILVRKVAVQIDNGKDFATLRMRVVEPEVHRWLSIRGSSEARTVVSPSTQMLEVTIDSSQLRQRAAKAFVEVLGARQDPLLIPVSVERESRSGGARTPVPAERPGAAAAEAAVAETHLADPAPAPRQKESSPEAVPETRKGDVSPRALNFLVVPGRPVPAERTLQVTLPSNPANPSPVVSFRVSRHQVRPVRSGAQGGDGSSPGLASAEAPSWLTLIPTEETQRALDGEKPVIRVRVEPGALSAGTHKAAVRFEGLADRIIIVPVTMVIDDGRPAEREETPQSPPKGNETGGTREPLPVNWGAIAAAASATEERAARSDREQGGLVTPEGLWSAPSPLAASLARMEREQALAELRRLQEAETHLSAEPESQDPTSETPPPRATEAPPPPPPPPPLEPPPPAPTPSPGPPHPGLPRDEGLAPNPPAPPSGPPADAVREEIGRFLPAFFVTYSQYLAAVDPSNPRSLEDAIGKLQSASCGNFRQELSKIAEIRNSPAPSCGPLSIPARLNAVQWQSLLNGLQMAGIEAECLLRALTQILCNPIERKPPAQGSLTVRSGMKWSGAFKGWSSWYKVCSADSSRPLEPGERITRSEFVLEGDRSCGNWAECHHAISSPTQHCWQFRLQGHDEFGFPHPEGRAQSEGVMTIHTVR